MVQESGFEALPSDILVDQTLRLARSWRRLAELRTWRPLADADAVRETLQSLGYGGAAVDAEIEDWAATLHRDESAPLLIRAGQAARDWMNRPGVAPQSSAGMFFAACLWREKGACRPIPLPFWSAPEPRRQRLELHVGLQWMADFLACVAAAAKTGLDELDRLRRAEEKGRWLTRTARSRLGEALDAGVRAPVVTGRDLAETLGISPQGALGLLGQLTEAGIVREVTGRRGWRAYGLA